MNDGGEFALFRVPRKGDVRHGRRLRSWILRQPQVASIEIRLLKLRPIMIRKSAFTYKWEDSVNRVRLPNGMEVGYFSEVRPGIISIFILRFLNLI
jgi:hypothetical protein